MCNSRCWTEFVIANCVFFLYIYTHTHAIMCCLLWRVEGRVRILLNTQHDRKSAPRYILWKMANKRAQTLECTKIIINASGRAPTHNTYKYVHTNTVHTHVILNTYITNLIMMILYWYDYDDKRIHLNAVSYTHLDY